jgi:DNA-binding XRE family transcriptional regulator
MRLSSDSFGRRLEAIRKSRGLTQGELGALVGRSKSAIRAWECGLYGVKVGDIMKYARALSCRLNDLLASVGAQLPRAPSNFGARHFRHIVFHPMEIRASGPTNCLIAGGRYPDPMAPNNPVVLHKEQLGGPLPTTSLSGQAHGSRCRSFLLGRRVGFRDRTCLAEAAIGQKIL